MLHFKLLCHWSHKAFSIPKERKLCFTGKLCISAFLASQVRWSSASLKRFYISVGNLQTCKSYLSGKNWINSTPLSLVEQNEKQPTVLFCPIFLSVLSSHGSLPICLKRWQYLLAPLRLMTKIKSWIRVCFSYYRESWFYPSSENDLLIPLSLTFSRPVYHLW